MVRLNIELISRLDYKLASLPCQGSETVPRAYMVHWLGMQIK